MIFRGSVFPPVDSNFIPSAGWIWSWTRLVTFARALLRKLMKIVPTIEQSGMQPQVPRPNVAISVNKTVSRLYPYPNTWRLHVNPYSSMNFLRVGTIPCGGFTLGSPSVKRATKVFRESHCLFLLRSRPTLMPSQMLVEPCGCIYLRALMAFSFPSLSILVNSRATEARSSKGTKASRSLLSREWMMVLMECFTRSSRVNPFCSTPLASTAARVPMDPELSRTQMIDTGFLFFTICSEGGSTVTLTTNSSPQTKVSTDNSSSSVTISGRNLISP